jgi:serpin B
MKRQAIPTILAILTMIPATGALDAVPSVQAGVVEDDGARTVAEANNEFGFALYGLVRQSMEGNVFLSPASLSTALAMTYGGARGETATEIRETLRWTLDGDDLHDAMEGLLSSLEGEDSGLALANALWGQRGMAFHRRFLDAAHRHYKAGFDEVDFEDAPDRARRTINAWIDERTDHEISELLLPGDVDPETILVLTNAIRFKGTWKVRFDNDETRPAAFRVSDDREVTVQMMRVAGAIFHHYDGEGLELLELPYDSDRISMLVLLPDEGSELAELEAKLSAGNLASWLSRMQPTRFRSVEIPRFESSMRLELRDALGRLGMPLAFTPEADFSGMTPSRPVWIDDVFHEARIRVDEEGTTAAGSSAVVLKKGPAPREADLFRADRPFLYLIRDRQTGAVLFFGSLVDPEA